jgi:hypothetical protein
MERNGAGIFGIRDDEASIFDGEQVNHVGHAQPVRSGRSDVVKQ